MDAEQQLEELTETDPTTARERITELERQLRRTADHLSLASRRLTHLPYAKDAERAAEFARAAASVESPTPQEAGPVCEVCGDEGILIEQDGSKAQPCYNCQPAGTTLEQATRWKAQRERDAIAAAAALPIEGESARDQELRERMLLIERFAKVLADPACDGDCEGSGMDEEGAEWSLCECALSALQRLERGNPAERPVEGEARDSVNAVATILRDRVREIEWGSKSVARAILAELAATLPAEGEARWVVERYWAETTATWHWRVKSGPDADSALGVPVELVAARAVPVEREHEVTPELLNVFGAVLTALEVHAPDDAVPAVIDAGRKALAAAQSGEHEVTPAELGAGMARGAQEQLSIAWAANKTLKKALTEAQGERSIRLCYERALSDISSAESADSHTLRNTASQALLCGANARAQGRVEFDSLSTLLADAEAERDCLKRILLEERDATNLGSLAFQLRELANVERLVGAAAAGEQEVTDAEVERVENVPDQEFIEIIGFRPTDEQKGKLAGLILAAARGTSTDQSHEHASDELQRLAARTLPEGLCAVCNLLTIGKAAGEWLCPAHLESFTAFVAAVATDQGRDDGR